jgi:hypothetical protein
LRRLQATLLRAALIVLVPLSSWSSDGRIALFFLEEGGFQCHDEIPCAGMGVILVYALLEGASVGGITGAEYGIEIGVDRTADPGWVFVESFAPAANVVLGEGFNPPDTGSVPSRSRGMRGVNVVFPTCQTGSQGMVLLETVEVRNGGCEPEALPLLVERHDRESSRRFLCPLFTLCDGPSYTKVCVGDDVHPCGRNAKCSTSGAAIINPEPGQDLPCATVPVDTTPWSRIQRFSPR